MDGRKPTPSAAEARLEVPRPPRRVKWTGGSLAGLLFLSALGAAAAGFAAAGAGAGALRITAAILAGLLAAASAGLAWAIRRDAFLMREGEIVEATVRTARDKASTAARVLDVLAAASRTGESARSSPFVLTFEFAPARGPRVTRTMTLDRRFLDRAFPEGLREGSSILVAGDSRRPEHCRPLRLGFVRVVDLPP